MKPCLATAMRNSRTKKPSAGLSECAFTSGPVAASRMRKRQSGLDSSLSPRVTEKMLERVFFLTLAYKARARGSIGMFDERARAKAPLTFQAHWRRGGFSHFGLKLATISSGVPWVCVASRRSSSRRHIGPSFIFDPAANLPAVGHFRAEKISEGLGTGHRQQTGAKKPPGLGTAART